MKPARTPHGPPESPCRPGLVRFGITRKMILLLLLVAIVPMLSVSYWNMRGALTRVGHMEEENLELLAISVAQRLDQWVKDSLLLVNFLAGEPEVIRLLSLPPEQRNAAMESARQTVLHLGRMSSEVASAYVMDREGRFLVSSHLEVVGKAMPEMEFFREALSGASYVSNLRFGSTSGLLGAYFSMPVRDEEKRVVGVAVIKMVGRVVQTIMEETNNSQVIPFLVDGDGVIIHHPDPEIRFRSLRPLTDEKIQHLLRAQNLPVTTITSLDDQQLADGMIGAKQSGHVRHFAPAWKSHLITGIAPMKNHSWVVGMSEDEANFILPLEELFDDSVRSLALVVAILIPLSLVIGHRLTRPLEVLTRASRLLEKRFSHSGQEEQIPDPGELIKLEKLTHNTDEFGQLSQVFQKMTQEVMRKKEDLDLLVMEKTRQLQDQNHLLASAQRRIETELRIAQAMQLAILPTHFPIHQSYGLYAIMRPALETGGDFYDFFILDEHRIGVVVADVSGKGVPAAFFMAISRTVLQGLGSKGLPPALCLGEANRQLCAQNPMELFVTLFYGIFDIQNGEFRYANGGHNPPYHLTSEGKVFPLPSSADVALGVMDNVDYREHSLRLKPHEKLFLFTDGVTEAFDVAGNAFGEERLVRSLEESRDLEPREVVERVIDALRLFLAGAVQSDDITCLAFAWNAWHEPLPRQDAPALAVGAKPLLEEQITTLADIPLLAERVEELGCHVAIASETVFQINLVLDEWLTNVLSYGFPSTDPPSARVRLFQGEGKWILEVVDSGNPYNPLEYPPPDTTSPLEERPIGGLGVHLMREMMDVVEYRRENWYNQLVMVKLIPPGPRQEPPSQSSG